jgi:hypothetical protein
VARAKIRFAPDERQGIAFGGLWLVSSFAITVFLPIRSDLYALTPSAGAVIIAACMLQAYSRTAPAATRHVLTFFVILSALLIPIYRTRNVRWVRPADLSRSMVTELQRVRPDIPPGSHVVLIDERNREVSLASAFSGLFQDAITLYIDRGCTGEITDRPAAYRSPVGARMRVFQRTGDRLVQVTTPATRRATGSLHEWESTAAPPTARASGDTHLMNLRRRDVVLDRWGVASHALITGMDESSRRMSSGSHVTIR